VTLCFLQGAGLPDPAKRLEGSGNVVRNIRLYNADEPVAHGLDEPEVREFMNLALNRAKRVGTMLPKLKAAGFA
jgi:hypothetical protein